MTLNEARKIQRDREQKAIILFVLSIGLVGLATYLLLEFTTIFSISSAFYLIPIGLLALAVKKTRIYLFLTPKEFKGKVVRLDVYPVKVGKVKGEHTYESSHGEALEVALYIDNGKTTKLKEMYSCQLTYKISVGTELSLLRFIDQPIIIEDKK